MKGQKSVHGTRRAVAAEAAEPQSQQHQETAEAIRAGLENIASAVLTLRKEIGDLTREIRETRRPMKSLKRSMDEFNENFVEESIRMMKHKAEDDYQ